MRWYKRDPDAALNGMAMLTLEEAGAYNIVIDLLYSRDGDLPDDEVLVSRVMRCNPRTWRRIKTRLIEVGKIWIENERIMAKRVEFTLNEARMFSERQSDRARKRWERDEKPNDINETPMRRRNANTTTTTYKERGYQNGKWKNVSDSNPDWWDISKPPPPKEPPPQRD